MFTSPDHNPPASIIVTTDRVKMPTRGFLGFRRIKSGSGGSTASASAGSPSVARFTWRIWTALSGNGKPASTSDTS